MRCITFGAKMFARSRSRSRSHRIQIDVAAEAVHVEHQSVVDEIHSEPDAQEAERDQAQILGAKQFTHAGHVFLLVRWGFEQFVQIVRQRSVVEGGCLPHDFLHLGDATFAEQPPGRFRKYEPVTCDVEMGSG